VRKESNLTPLMRTLFLCNSDTIALPAALQLKHSGHLTAVAIPDKHQSSLQPALVASGIDASHIHIVTQQQLAQQLTALCDAYNIELIIVLTFPWKLPTGVLLKPAYGCINMHPGLLPAYKGGDPVFWQLKNREQNGGIAVHIMTDVWDEGPLLMQQPLPLIPGETYGLHCQRIGGLASEMILKILDAVKAKEYQTTTITGNYYKKPTATDTTIHWQTQTAAEIEALVNACNPRYSGALTSIRQMPLSVLEVAIADIANVPTTIPGTVVYADQVYGLIVACSDQQFLKINIIQTSAGYLSGSKLFQLGFNKGDRFL